MKDLVKNFFVVFICTFLVLSAMSYTRMISLGPLWEKMTNGVTASPHPKVPIIEEQDMPSILEATSGVPTSAPPPEVQGSLYPLQQPSSDRIGTAGLLPATPVSVVKRKTETKIEFDACTVAFSLPNKAGDGSYAITAGHCGKAGQDVYTAPSQGNFSKDDHLGQIVYSSQMNEKTGSTDWAVIKLNAQAKRPKHTTKITMSLDTYPRPVDKTVCKRGSTTGFDCGKKGEDGVRTKMRLDGPEDEEVVAVLSKAYLCALPGDSGSPVFDKEGIIGVLSSTSASQSDIENRKCETNNVAFYSPITSVIAEIEKAVPDIEF